MLPLGGRSRPQSCLILLVSTPGVEPGENLVCFGFPGRWEVGFLRSGGEGTNATVPQGYLFLTKKELAEILCVYTPTPETKPGVEGKTGPSPRVHLHALSPSCVCGRGRETGNRMKTPLMAAQTGGFLGPQKGRALPPESSIYDGWPFLNPTASLQSIQC